MPRNRLQRLGLDRAAAAGGAACLLAVAADLLTKTYAVDTGRLGLVAYNDTHAGDLLRRLVMSLVAFAVTAAIALGARRRGLGRQWGAWFGTGLLVGGVLANGLSSFIWSQGVPDFIHVYSLSPDVWDVADFEIALGLTGGIASVALAAVVAYARARRAIGRGPVPTGGPDTLPVRRGWGRLRPTTMKRWLQSCRRSGSVPLH